MASATIKMFLLHGDGKRLRWAEISNWSGKALAAPRTEFDEFLSRAELTGSGVYILTGTDPVTGKPMAYIGEGEVLAERLKSHKSKDFWVAVFVFLSKDENLTKGHIKYLEGRLIERAKAANRFILDNSQASGAKLPEADRHDMDEFLEKVIQLLPILGSDVLTPIGGDEAKTPNAPILTTEVKGLVAQGRRTATGFLVLSGSQAVAQTRPSTEKWAPTLLTLRQQLLNDGSLEPKDGHLVFAREVEFSSPSAAASVVNGGNMNGLLAWRDEKGVTLGDLEKE